MDDQKILASSENFGAVTVCSGGVIHINMPHFTIKFLPSDFMKFSDLIAKAKLNYDPPQKLAGKPRLQLVTSDEDESEVDDRPDK